MAAPPRASFSSFWEFGCAKAARLAGKGFRCPGFQPKSAGFSLAREMLHCQLCDKKQKNGSGFRHITCSFLLFLYIEQ